MVRSVPATAHLRGEGDGGCDVVGVGMCVRACHKTPSLEAVSEDMIIVRHWFD